MKITLFCLKNPEPIPIKVFLFSFYFHEKVDKVLENLKNVKILRFEEGCGNLLAKMRFYG